MKQQQATTATAGFGWTTTYQAFESYAEVMETLGEAGIMNIANASQKQSATQGPKSEVLKAVKKAYAELEVELPTKDTPLGEDARELVGQDADVAAAVVKYNEAVLEFVISGAAGGTRAKGFGSKKAQRKLGEVLAEKLGTEGLEKLAEAEGVTLEELLADAK